MRQMDFQEKATPMVIHFMYTRDVYNEYTRNLSQLQRKFVVTDSYTYGHFSGKALIAWSQPIFE